MSKSTDRATCDHVERTPAGDVQCGNAWKIVVGGKGAFCRDHAPIDVMLARRVTLERLAAEVHALAELLGMSASVSLHGEAWPPGWVPDGSLLVTCHGYKHTVHSALHLRGVLVIVGRDATDDEAQSKPGPEHDSKCLLHRCERHAGAAP